MEGNSLAPSTGQHDWSKRCTHELRTSPSLRWQRFRDRLESEGIAPIDAAISFLGPDGSYRDSGIVATRDGRVFEFDLSFTPGDRDDSEVERLEELPEQKLVGFYAKAAALARELIQGDSQAGG